MSSIVHSLTAAGNGTSTYKSAPEKISDWKAAAIVNYTLVVALVLFTVAALPRAIARFSSPDAWSQGWILRHAPPRVVRNPLQRVPTIRRDPTTGEKRLTYAPRNTGTGHVLGHWSSRYGNGAAVDPNNFDIQATRIAPRHMPSLRTVLYPVSSQFSRAIFGYSTGQFLLLVLYAVLICIGMFLYSNPVTNARRAGWIAMSQIPVSFLLASKNSLIGLLVGKGYEKLNYLHRWVGQLICIATLFHVVSYLVMWTKANNLSTKMQGPTEIAGTVAVGGITLLAVCALPMVRNKYWAIFTYGHVIGFSIAIVALCYHVTAALPWGLISFGIYGIDLLLRVIQSHYVPATLHYLPELRATRVVVPSLHSGWRAGQHVRLSVVSSAMGMKKAVESHPFTIASTSEDEEGLVLYCREAGDWTKQLAQVARGRAGGQGNGEKGLGAGVTVNVLVQGPYGGPGNAVFSSYSGALFVCGGGGITFGLSATQDVIRDAFDRCSRLRVVDLVWIVQDPAAINPLLPAFNRLIAQANSISSVSLHIHVHYTRASSIVPSDIELPEHVTLVPGRPELSDMLSATIDCTSGLKQSTADGVHGVVVASCGPPELMGRVRAVEHAVGSRMRAACGGVEIVEEAFAW